MPIIHHSGFLTLARSLAASFIVMLLTPAAGFAQVSATSVTGVRNAPGEGTGNSSVNFSLKMTLAGENTIRNQATLGQDVSITATIQPEPGQVGQLADIIIVDYLPPSLTMRNSDGNFVAWNGSLRSLTPYLEGIQLEDNLDVEVFSGRLGTTGNHRIFIGYLVGDALYFTPSPLRFDIEEEPVTPPVSSSGSFGTPITYTPGSCQADIELLLEAIAGDVSVPVVYKGNLYGTRTIVQDFSRNAIVRLTDESPVAVAGTQPAGFGDGARLQLGLQELVAAPDLGQENDPDYPLAFKARVSINLDDNDTLLRADGSGGVQKIVAEGDEVNFGDIQGVVNTVKNVRLAAENAVFFTLTLKGSSDELLVQQSVANGALQLLLAENQRMDSADENESFYVESFDPPRILPLWEEAVVTVQLKNEGGVHQGFAMLRLDPSANVTQVIASDLALSSGASIQINNSTTLESIDSDGATTGVVLSTDGQPRLEYKVISQPVSETLEKNALFGSAQFNGFSNPQVCDFHNALYFVGNMWTTGKGAHDELFRINESGTVEQLTDFRSLLDDTSLKGEVPDSIKNYTLGYQCDAVMYTWGPSGSGSNQGYEGYWAAYASGEVVEILDETPERPNGNGTITSVQDSISNIQIGESPVTVPALGANGEFHFILRENSGNSTINTHAVATKPGCS